MLVIEWDPRDRQRPRAVTADWGVTQPGTRTAALLATSGTPRGWARAWKQDKSSSSSSRTVRGAARRTPAQEVSVAGRTSAAPRLHLRVNLETGCTSATCARSAALGRSGARALGRSGARALGRSGAAARPAVALLDGVARADAAEARAAPHRISAALARLGGACAELGGGGRARAHIFVPGGAEAGRPRQRRVLGGAFGQGQGQGWG